MSIVDVGQAMSRVACFSTEAGRRYGHAVPVKVVQTETAKGMLLITLIRRAQRKNATALQITECCLCTATKDKARQCFTASFNGFKMQRRLGSRELKSHAAEGRSDRAVRLPPSPVECCKPSFPIQRQWHV